MGGATREFYLEVFRDTLRILQGAGVDHLVIGGVATRVLLSRPLNEQEDIDFLVRPEDAEGLVETFAGEGYATHRRDERWIYKVARPDVTVDLIFRAGETIEMDEEHLARSSSALADGISLPVPSPEDLAVMKAVFDADDRQGRWYDTLDLLEQFPVDWGYLVERGLRHAPRRVLSVLLYAVDEGISVPEDALERLVPAATSPSG